MTRTFSANKYKLKNRRVIVGRSENRPSVTGSVVSIHTRSLVISPEGNPAVTSHRLLLSEASAECALNGLLRLGVVSNAVVLTATLPGLYSWTGKPKDDGYTHFRPYHRTLVAREAEQIVGVYATEEDAQEAAGRFAALIAKAAYPSLLRAVVARREGVERMAEDYAIPGVTKKGRKYVVTDPALVLGHAIEKALEYDAPPPTFHITPVVINA